MKLLVIMALVAAAIARPDGLFYDSKYDDFDLEPVLSNPRVTEQYTDCMIGDGPCTKEGREIREWIPDGIQTSCAKCTNKQKILVARFIKAIQESHKEKYEKLYKKHDPEHKRTAELEEFLSQYAT